MSRFVLTAKNAVELCLFAAEHMKEEDFLAKYEVAAIQDVATAPSKPGSAIQEIGLTR